MVISSSSAFSALEASAAPAMGKAAAARPMATSPRADRRGHHLVTALRRLAAGDLAIYQMALEKIEALRGKETATTYAQRAAKAKARNQKSGGQKQPDWGPALVWRQPAMHLSKADKEVFQEDKSAPIFCLWCSMLLSELRVSSTKLR